MSNDFSLKTVLVNVATAASFEDFRAWAAARAGEIDAQEKIDADEKAAAASVLADAAKAESDAIESFDPSKIDKQTAVEMGLTNGMPDWLIRQKWAAWKLANSDV